MNTLPPPRRCPACSAEIPAEAPQGLCPKCLLLGVASDVDPRGDSVSSSAGAKPETGAPPGRDRGRESDKRSIPPSIEELAPAFPQLEIIGLIGRGGMGFVYKARQPKLDRFVALKILPGHLANEPSFHERFEREARVLAKLQHPLIVSVYDFGEAVPVQKNDKPPGPPVAPFSQRENDNPILNPSHDAHQPPVAAAVPVFYLVLEYVDGVNLREAMRAGRFTPEQALAIVPQVCEALQYAHSKGVLHRDIKPENILLDTEGRVKIADFGIAKVLDPEIDASSNLASAGGVSESEMAVTRLTATGSVLGTPLYMAPEQLIRPNSVDHRADIFSLGVVFYEMLTGELPMGRFAPPSEKSLVDQRIDEVVMRALAKERELRQQSAGEMKSEVETIVSHPQKTNKRSSVSAGSMPARQTSSSGQVTYGERESPWPRRFFWLLVGVIAMVMIVPVLIIVAIVIPLFWGYSSNEAHFSNEYRPNESKGVLRSDRPSNEAHFSNEYRPPASAVQVPTRVQKTPVPPTLDGPLLNGQSPATESAASIEAKRLGLILVVSTSSEVRSSEQPIGLPGVEGDVLVEPYFSALVRLQLSTNRLFWNSRDRFNGTILPKWINALYPCDYIACDWSSGADRPPILGYLLPPGAYDFRPEIQKETWSGLKEATGRAEAASLVLKFVANAAAKSEAAPSDWQKATQAAHLRFKLIPKSISKLNVPDECLVVLTDDSRTIFTRDAGRFTKYELASANLIRGLHDRMAKPTTTNLQNKPPVSAEATPVEANPAASDKDAPVDAAVPENRE